jgi:adenylate cyclase
MIAGYKFFISPKIHCFFLIVVLILVYPPKKITGKDNYYGVPYIQNYSPTDYGSERQNVSMVQDHRGVSYFGNQNGILIYDRIGWRNIYLPGFPRMDISTSGRIYVGGFNEFGYISTEGDEVNYLSLKNQFLKAENFGLVVNVVTSGENTFFESVEHLYLYHHEYVQLIDKKIVPRAVFKAGNHIFINHSSKGLCLFEDNRVVEIPGGIQFAGKNIVDVFFWKERYFIRIADEPDFWIYQSGNFSRAALSLEEYFTEHQYAHAITLPNNQLAVATRGNGIFIIDEKGEMQLHITKVSGLQDEFVNSLYADIYGNLWACLRNGISRIEYPSSYSFFNMKNNFDGGVFSIIRQDSMLYVGTDNGIYKRGKDYLRKSEWTRPSFTKIEVSTGIAFQFFRHQRSVFLSASKGIFRIEGGEAEKAYSKPSRVTLSVNDSLLVSGWDGSVEFLRWDGQQFKLIAQESSISGRVQYIQQDEEGAIWLSTSYYGLYRIVILSHYPFRYQIEVFSNTEQIPSGHGLIQLEKGGSRVFFYSEVGLLRFDRERKKFLQDEEFYKQVEFRKEDLHAIKCDNSGNLYLFANSIGGEKQNLYRTIERSGSFQTPERISIREVNDFAIETVYADQDGILWFCGAGGLIRYNQQFKARTETYPFIFRQLNVQGDSVVLIPPSYQMTGAKKDYFSVDYWDNQVRISYVCPAHIAGTDFEYSFLLEKYDKEWSPWMERTYKEYNNLDPGRYVFRVKCRDVMNGEIEEISLGLWIRPPWYMTRLAYGIYLLLFLTFSWMLLKIRSYQYAREKIELERQIKEKTDDLVKEIERSEDLLLNMLPREISKELRMHGRAATAKYEMVTVMFMDIQGFTIIAELVDPDVLVRSLDRFFLNVDRIISKYNIEKIKTIGDGYMSAGGVPVKNRTNPIEVVLAALEVQEFIKDFHFENADLSDISWGLRIGIHTGPVIAGVIGDSKLSYDIWGVTVNSASRMESNGVPGRVVVSQQSNELIKSYFDTEYHGSLTLRSGKITEMYTVKGLKKAFRSGLMPYDYNQLLRFELAELRYADLYEWVIQKLEKELPDNLYYHNVLHTVDVVSSARRLCREEQLDAESDLLVRTAALLHDIGFVVDYDNHEVHSVRIAKEVLPSYHYSVKQIEQVCKLIMSTHYPPNPTDHLEEIICDADLDYLGRRDFVNGSKNLYMELHQRKKIKSSDEWIKTQIAFIETHTYFTKSAIRSREVNKIQQLDNLRKMDFLSGFF